MEGDSGEIESLRRKERLSSFSAKRKIMWSLPKQMEQKGEHKTVPKEAC